MNEQKKFDALKTWFRTPQGKGVALAFNNELKLIQSALHGKILLQLGDCGDNPWLELFDYQYQWMVSPNVNTYKSSVRASMHALPFDRETVNCIIAPMTLEACYGDKNPIDEMDRILSSMGYIVFLGINPWSFWGASLRWGRLSCFAHVSATLSSSLSLKHAMLSRGYRQCFLSSFYYIPPINNEYWIHKLEFLNQMGKMVWPYPAGFYCLIMQKQTHCMTAVSYEPHDEFYLAQT